MAFTESDISLIDASAIVPRIIGDTIQVVKQRKVTPTWTKGTRVRVRMEGLMFHCYSCHSVNGNQHSYGVPKN